MRNAEGDERGTWAAYAQAARERVGLGKTEVARLTGKDRATIHRWETGRSRPEDSTVVAAFAAALRLDLDEALAAAGMRPGATPPTEPTQQVDEELDLILRSRVSPDMKRRMIARLEELRERDKQQRMEDIAWWLERGA
jgi:transcriptional regulator with XRE-family HTH domain